MADVLDKKIKVLELAISPAVSIAGRFLADVGATVVLVEDSADSQMAAPAAQARNRDTALFHYLNTGKESIALDLNQEASWAAVEGLLRWADCALVDEEFRGTCQPLIDKVVEESSLVVTYVTPFGTSGPYSDYKAVSGATFASSGEAAILPSGLGYELFPDRGPLLSPGQVTDYDTGMIALLVTCGALYTAQAGQSEGLVIDLSRQEAAVSLNKWLVSHFTSTGWIETRANKGNRLVETSDGYAIFAPSTNEHFASLRKVMGGPEWFQDERWMELAYRQAHLDELRHELRVWASSRTKDEILALAHQYETPGAPILTAEEIFRVSHFRERQFLQEVEMSGQDTLWPRLPFAMPDVELPPLREAPDKGRDTERILRDYCGLQAIGGDRGRGQTEQRSAHEEVNRG